MRNLSIAAALCTWLMGFGLAPAWGEASVNAYLDRSYYTHEAQARVVVTLNARVPAAGWQADVALTVHGKKQAVSGSAAAARTRLVLAVGLASVPQGEHSVRVRVRTSDGRSLAEPVLKLVKREPAPPGVREVKVDHERVIALVDGKPFFPIGVFGVPPRYMREVAAVGVNCVVRWSRLDMKSAREQSDAVGRARLNEYLDAAQHAGLSVIETPMYSAYERMRYSDPEFPAKLVRFMQNPLPFVAGHAGQHPAVVALYGLDEPNLLRHHIQGGEPAVRRLCADLARTVAGVAPYRLRYFVFYGHGHEPMRDWPESCDVAGQDYYYIGRASPMRCLRAVRSGVEVLRRRRTPYWLVAMCELCSTAHRGLTPAEQRIQAYIAVIAGVKGLNWWCWPPRHRDNWAALKRLASELRDLTPILAGSTPDVDVEYGSVEASESVQLLVKTHGAKTYLIAANASEHGAAATLSLPPEVSGPAKVWFEGRSVTIRDGELRDVFAGYGTHVYELNCAWPAHGRILVTAKLSPEKQITTPLRAAPAEGVKGANRLGNPSFEEETLPGWPDYWRPGHGLDAPGMIGTKESPWGTDREVAFHGAKSLRIEMREPLPKGYHFELYSAYARLPKAKKRYVYSVHLKADRPGVVALAFVRGGSKKVKLTTDWQRVQVPTELSGGRINVYLALKSAGTIWVDAAQLEEGDTASAFVASGK